MIEWSAIPCRMLTLADKPGGTKELPVARYKTRPVGCDPDSLPDEATLALIKLFRLVSPLSLLALCLAASVSAQHPSPSKPAAPDAKPQESLLVREIRHQILVLPFYSVFDYVTFTLNGDKVILTGQVLRPNLKSSAEAAVLSIEGVRSVTNQIEVLPKLSSDDDLRRSVYRAIFEDSMLQRYAVLAVPPIHILVKNGVVTLEGSVGSEIDRKLAATRATGVSGVSNVINNLAIRPKNSTEN